MEKQYIFPRRKAAASGGPPLQFFSKWGLQKAKHMRKMQKITRIKKIWVEQNMTLQFLTQNFPRRKSLLFMMCLRHLFPWLCNWRKNSNFTSYRPEIHCKSWTAQYHKLSTTQDGWHSCREYYDICLVSGVTLWSELQPDTCVVGVRFSSWAWYGSVPLLTLFGRIRKQDYKKYVELPHKMLHSLNAFTLLLHQ